jgi:hypothetical protein
MLGSPSRAILSRVSPEPSHSAAGSPSTREASPDSGRSDDGGACVIGFRSFFGEQLWPPRLSPEADRAEGNAVLHAIEIHAVDVAPRDRAFPNGPAEQTKVRDDRPLVFRRVRG